MKETVCFYGDEFDNYEKQWQDEVDHLESIIESFKIYTIAQEQHEANMMLHEERWFNQMPRRIYDEMLKVQSLRNKALEPFRK